MRAPTCDDGAHWVSTSDHLAEDKQVYKLLATLGEGKIRIRDTPMQ